MMLLYMLPLLCPRSTLTLTMHESATCRLYSGSEVMDTERLCWEARGGFGRVAEEQRSARQSEEEEEELEGVRESGEETEEV